MRAVLSLMLVGLLAGCAGSPFDSDELVVRNERETAIVAEITVLDSEGATIFNETLELPPASSRSASLGYLSGNIIVTAQVGSEKVTQDVSVGSVKEFINVIVTRDSVSIVALHGD